MFFRKNPPASGAAEGGPQEEAEQGRPGLLSRLRAGIARTRAGLVEGLARIVVGRKRLDANSLEDLETLLLTADVGIEATSRLIEGLVARLGRSELTEPEAVYAALEAVMVELLQPVERPLVLPADGPRPFVMLMVGVNGAGKTTTCGKLASRFKAEGRSVLLAAGDTFRAAAVEQLLAWGERTGVPVVAQGAGADAASVIFDAASAARARGSDLLIADTAGRLHTQAHLMREVEKVKRVLGRFDATAPHETLLVLDATAGQNALNQAQEFHRTLGLTGLVLTKLDGTARGGIVFALAAKLGVPIRCIGIGEGVEDLRPFVAADFVAALLDRPR